MSHTRRNREARAGIADLKSAFADGPSIPCAVNGNSERSSKAGYFAIEETADDFAAQGISRVHVAVLQTRRRNRLPNRSFGSSSAIFPVPPGVAERKLCLDFGRLSTAEVSRRGSSAEWRGIMASDSSGKIEIVMRPAIAIFRHWNLVRFAAHRYQESLRRNTRRFGMQFFVMGDTSSSSSIISLFRGTEGPLNLFFCLFILDSPSNTPRRQPRIVYRSCRADLLHARLVGFRFPPLAPLFMAFVVLFFPKTGRSAW
jgi:hypothetical protein